MPSWCTTYGTIMNLICMKLKPILVYNSKKAIIAFGLSDVGVSSIVVGVTGKIGAWHLVVEIGSIEGTVCTSLVSLVLVTNTEMLTTVLLDGTVPSTFFLMMK